MPADENDKKLLEYVRGAEFAGFVNARAQVKEMIWQKERGWVYETEQRVYKDEIRIVDAK